MVNEMNIFNATVKKEALQIVRDKRTMLVVLVIPVMLMLLFGFAISTEVNSVRVMSVVTINSAAVSEAVARLDANPYIRYIGSGTEADAEAMLRSGKCSVAVIFADDYAVSGKARVLADGADPNMSASASLYVKSILDGVNPLSVRMFRTTMRHNPQMKSAYNFVPGVMGLIFILICAMMTSVSIVREKELGTMEILLVSPVRPVVIIFAKMVPYLLLSCVNLMTILLIGRYVLGVPMSGSMVAIVGISVLYLVLSLSLGLLISTVARKQIVALLVSAVVMMMPIMMFSGMMFPVENIPLVLQPISFIVPARWYIDAMRKLMVEGVPVQMVMKDTLILVSMTCVVLAAALKNFNDKLE